MLFLHFFKIAAADHQSGIGAAGARLGVRIGDDEGDDPSLAQELDIEVADQGIEQDDVGEFRVLVALFSCKRGGEERTGFDLFRVKEEILLAPANDAIKFFDLYSRVTSSPP